MTYIGYYKTLQNWFGQSMPPLPDGVPCPAFCSRENTMITEVNMLSTELKSAMRLIGETDALIQNGCCKDAKKILKNITTISDLLTKSVTQSVEKILAMVQAQPDGSIPFEGINRVIEQIETAREVSEEIDPLLNRVNKNSDCASFSICLRLCQFNHDLREFLYRKVLGMVIKLAND